MNTPKTIITYLIEGNPQGIKTIELSNWVGKAISIPRSQLKEAKNRSEVNKPALYFLFGTTEDGSSEIAYIGETENLISRIATHDTNKDFWDTVVAFISKDNNLTKADVKFLESKALELAEKSGRYQLDNTAKPDKNTLPEHQEATMIEFLNNVDLLISSIGYPILKEIESVINTEKEIYYIKSKGVEGTGKFIPDGFVILKGSKGNDVIPSHKNHSFYGFRIRPKLIEKGIIKEVEDNKIEFLQDYLFRSPSGAAALILGRVSNGWMERKDKSGKTLDENERQDLEVIK